MPRRIVRTSSTTTPPVPTRDEETLTIDDLPFEPYKPGQEHWSHSPAATILGVLAGIVLGMAVSLFVLNPIFALILQVYPTISKVLVFFGTIVLLPSLIVMMIREKRTSTGFYHHNSTTRNA